MPTISSCWALMIRAARMRTDGPAPCEGAQPAITMAWAWWAIMPVMKATSAAVYGMRALSARAAAMASASLCWLAADAGAGAGAGALAGVRVHEAVVAIRSV